MSLTVNKIPRFKGTVGGQQQVQDSAIADNGTNITLSRALSGTYISASAFTATVSNVGAAIATTVNTTTLIATSCSSTSVQTPYITATNITASVSATIATINATQVIATGTTSTSISGGSLNVTGANFTGVTLGGLVSTDSAGITGMAIIPQIASTTGGVYYVNGIVVRVVQPT